MREKIQYLTKGDGQPFLVYTLIMMVFRWMMVENPILDTVRYFALQMDQYSLFDFLKMRYETWSSRVFIEAGLYFLAPNLFLLKLVDVLMWILLLWSMAKILNVIHEKRYLWYLVAFTLMYSLLDLSTAGWGATAANYSWPLACGVFAMTAIAKIYRKEAFAIYQYPLYILACLYACNMEQMCAVMFVFFFFAVIYFAVAKKEKPVLLFVEWFLSLASLIFIMTCPGNSARSVEEMETGLKQFYMMSPLEKLYYGFDDAMMKLLASDLVLFAFCLVLFVIIVKKYQKTSYTMLAAIPVAFSFRSSDIWEFLQRFDSFWSSDQLLNASNYMLPGNYINLIFQIAFIAIILLELVLVADSYLEWLAMFVILGMGLAAKVVLGFSPSLYSSVRRPLILMDFAMVFMAVYLLKKEEALLSQQKWLQTVIQTVICLFAIMGTLNTAAYIAIWI